MMDTVSKEMKDRHRVMVLLALVVTLPLAYYAVVLLHEWGHGTTAWLFGYKGSPFDAFVAARSSEGHRGECGGDTVRHTWKRSDLTVRGSRALRNHPA